MNLISAREKCSECPIRHRAVCARCEPDELARLEQIKYYRTYEAGQPVMWAGDPLTFVGSVVRGVARLSQTLPDGRTQVVGLLMSSDFLGRPGREVLGCDVTAISDLTLCCFRRKPFETLLAETPHLTDRLLELALDELDAARDWMLLLGRKTAREKIASLLAIFARRTGTTSHAAPGVPVRQPGTGPLTIDLVLSRELMADFLGLTIETTSRQISALKSQGVIALEGNRRVIVPDLRRLLAETGDDIGLMRHDQRAV